MGKQSVGVGHFQLAKWVKCGLALTCLDSRNKMTGGFGRLRDDETQGLNACFK